VDIRGFKTAVRRQGSRKREAADAPHAMEFAPRGCRGAPIRAPGRTPAAVARGRLVYPFNPLRAMLSVNCFWVKKYKIKMGMTEMTAPAICRFISAPASSTN